MHNIIMHTTLTIETPYDECLFIKEANGRSHILIMIEML